MFSKKNIFTVLFFLFCLIGQSQTSKREVAINGYVWPYIKSHSSFSYLGLTVSDKFLKTKFYQKVNFNIYTSDGTIGGFFSNATTKINLGYGLGYKYIVKKLYFDLSACLGGLYIYGNYGDKYQLHVGAFLLGEFSIGMNLNKWSMGTGLNWGYGRGVSYYNYFFNGFSFKVNQFGVAGSLFLRVGFKF